MLNDVNKRKYFISNLMAMDYILQSFGKEFIKVFYESIPYPLNECVKDISFQIYDYTNVFLDFKVLNVRDEEFMDWLDNYTDGISFDNTNEEYTIVSTSLYDLYSFVKDKSSMGVRF